jgi:hypothetical protein
MELWLMPQLLQDKPNVFKDDGSPPNIHSEVTTFLNSQTPDLTSTDFFLWGFVKGEVYFPSVRITLNNSRDRISKAIAKTDRPLLRNVWHEIKSRPDVCSATNGAHIELA